jgi:hypothetical protein
MMGKCISTLIILTYVSWGFSQNRLWLSSGVNTNVLSKKLNVEARFTARFYDNERWDKFFPEISAKYKVHKNFKPSIDYRYVLNQQRTGPRVTAGHRVNLNLNSGVSYERFDFKFRVRFQYKFNRFASSPQDTYEPDFDNAIRFKPVVKYNIKGSKIDPRMEGEWFYNTNNSPEGNQFTKFRFGVGADIKLPNKNVLTVKYRYDHEFNLADPRRFHILSLAHDYTYKKSKSKGRKSRI